MGVVHDNLGNYDQAKDYHELALNSREKNLGPEHVHVATSYHNLGLVHDNLGNYEQAKEYHELALKIRQKKS